MDSSLRSSWTGIEASVAEGRYRSLASRLRELESLVESQALLSQKEPTSLSYQLARASLISRRERLQTELAEVLQFRTTEQITVSLEGKLFSRQSADLIGLASFLQNLQRLFTSILQAVSTGPTQRGPFSHEVEEMSQLRLATTFDSSFGVVVQAKTQTDVFGDSLVLSSLGAMFSVLNALNDKSQLLETLGGLGPRVTTHVRRLLWSLDRAESKSEIGWIRPSGDSVRWKADAETMPELRANIVAIKSESSSSFSLLGVLVGGSLIRNRFEFQAEPDNRIIVGSVSKESLVGLRRGFGQRCRAELTQTTNHDVVSGETKSFFTLTRVDLVA